MVAQLVQRLEGVSQEEYLWEPLPGMWSIRQRPDGTVAADGVGADRDLSPAPVTTMAWRLWHIARDCFDDYARRLHGNGDDDLEPDAAWFLEPEPAIEAVQNSWANYRGIITSRGWWTPLGESFGPWAQHSTLDMAMHAHNEFVHHAAEVALLRDLYPLTNQHT